VAVRLPGASVLPGSDGLRALAASIYVNDCQEVLVLAHTDCGVARVKPDELRRIMRARGVPDADIPEDAQAFFGLVPDTRKAVMETARTIRAAPFLPRNLPVHVGEIDIRTGVVSLLESGYEHVYR
jgi:carbonic anhydrase